MSEGLNPLESLQSTIAGDTRNWSLNATDAWLYAIVVGWGNALGDVARQHNWDGETLSQLRQLRIKFHELEARAK